MDCPICKMSNRDTDEFCLFCGYKLSLASSEARIGRKEKKTEKPQESEKIRAEVVTPQKEEKKEAELLPISQTAKPPSYDTDWSTAIDWKSSDKAESSSLQKTYEESLFKPDVSPSDIISKEMIDTPWGKAEKITSDYNKREDTWGITDKTTTPTERADIPWGITDKTTTPTERADIPWGITDKTTTPTERADIPWGITDKTTTPTERADIPWGIANKTTTPTERADIPWGIADKTTTPTERADIPWGISDTSDKKRISAQSLSSAPSDQQKAAGSALMGTLGAAVSKMSQTSMPGKPLDDESLSDIDETWESANDDLSLFKSQHLFAGKYQVIKRLSSNPCGQVFLGKQSDTETRIIIKEVHISHLSPREKAIIKQLIEEETKLLVNLKHRNLPKVLDYFAQSHNIYIVMEYIRGKNLNEVLQSNPQGKIPVIDALKWMRVMVNALNYLHKQPAQIIHRDVDPKNMILTPGGQVVLVDLGASKPIRHPKRRIMEHPAFDSPEAYRGEYSIASDIYGLGASFHYLITGEHPSKRKNFVFPPLVQYRSDIPPDLQQVFNRMLALNLSERYRNMDAVRSALDNVIRVLEVNDKFSSPLGQTSQKPVPPRRTSPPAASAGRRSPAVTTPSSGGYSPPPAQDIPPVQQKESCSGCGCIIAIIVLYILYRFLTQVVSSMQNQEPIKTTKFDNWNIQRIFEGHTQAVRSSVFSLDEKHIISGSADGTIRIWDIDTAKTIKSINKKAGEIYSISLSPAGDNLLWGTLGKTVLTKITSEENIWVDKEHKGEIISTAFSPDGLKAASGGKDGRLKLYDAMKGESLRILPIKLESIRKVAFSPSGEFVTVGSEDGRLMIMNADTGDFERALTSYNNSLSTFAYSNDGKTIAMGGSEGSLVLWNTSTGDRIMEVSNKPHWVYSLAFTPCNKYIACGSAIVTNNNFRQDLIRIYDTEKGGLAAQLSGHKEGTWSLCFSSDGENLLSSGEDGKIYLWGNVLSKN